MECNMRSLNTKLALSALGILTMFASPALAQEPHHRHASLQVRDVGRVGPSGRAVYNMVITPDPSQRGNIYNMVVNPRPNGPALLGEALKDGFQFDQEANERAVEKLRRLFLFLQIRRRVTHSP